MCKAAKSTRKPQRISFSTGVFYSLHYTQNPELKTSEFSLTAHLIKLIGFPTPSFSFHTIIKTENSELKTLELSLRHIDQIPRFSNSDFPILGIGWCKMENSERKTSEKYSPRFLRFQRTPSFRLHPIEATYRVFLAGTLGSLELGDSESGYCLSCCINVRNSFIDPQKIYSLQFKFNLHNKFNKFTPSFSCSMASQFFCFSSKFSPS